MAQMPRNRFPFAVRVSCEVNLRRGACLFADAVENFAAPADRDVLKGKVVVHVHANLAFGQVAHMALRGFDLVALAQKFADGSRLGGRFDNNEFLLGCRHGCLPLR